MVNSFIAKKDLESEFSVVRNEFESGENNPFRVTIQKLMAVAYDWHNYGKSTIGARSDIENVPIDRLQAFYRKYYQPDNAVLLVAGKFDVDKTLKTINEKFGAIPRPERKLPEIYTVEPTQDGERMVTIRRVGDIQLAMAGYHVAPDTHPDTGALNVLERIMGDTPSGRLYKNLVTSKKAVSIASLNFPMKDPGYMMFGAVMQKDQNADAAKEELISTIESFGDAAPTKEEVERAKTQLIKNFELTLNDPNRVGLGMSEYIAQGDWRLFFITRDRIKAVTPADVQRVAKKYFKRANRTVARFIPTEKPDRAEVPTVSDEEIAKKAAAFKGGEAVASGEAFDPSPLNIDSRTQRMEIGDIKVAMLEKQNRGDTVFANMRFKFGTEKSLMNRSTAASFAGSLLDKGTATKTRQQIQDEFDRLKAQVNIGGGSTGANVSIETTRENLPAVMRLVAEIVKTPSFPESEFSQLKEQRLNGLESGRSNPQQVAIREMQQHFNTYPKGHFRYSGTLEEQIADIKAVTLDDVKKFHKDFYGASDAEFAIVGDFDGAEIGKLATELFGNWKSPGKYERVPSKYADISAVDKKFETPDKANAFFIARLNLKMNTDEADYPAMRVAQQIIGGGFLNSRLATRIRQKDGISYGVGAQMQIPSRDDSGAFLAFAIYAPQNLARLETAFDEEIQKVITEGFTEQEVKQAIAGIVGARKRQRANDAGLAGTLRNYLDLNRTFDWDADYEKKLEALTVAEVNAAAKKYLTKDKFSFFKAGDFANAGKKADAAKPGSK